MQLTIDKYTQMVAPLDVRDLDLSNAFHDDRLDADSLRCLRYMHDIELHTICYLRDLLVTSAHRDPEITTFLTFWSFEEFWHGEAIAQVLRAHGEPQPATCELDAGTGTLRIRLHRPARGIARGQAAVLYDGNVVLGSATISAVSRSQPAR